MVAGQLLREGQTDSYPHQCREALLQQEHCLHTYIRA